MRKIQFFEASGRHGDLIEKTKNRFLNKVNRSMCVEFQVCIVFRLAKRRDTNHGELYLTGEESTQKLNS